MDEDDIGGSGYSIDDLSAYLDSGRTPRNEAIERNAECRSVLASLEHMGRLSRELMESEARESAADDSSPAWLRNVLTTISREVRAGRDIPYPGADERTTLAVTEGAVRSAIRAAGDEIPGVLVTRSRLDGDLDSPGAPLRVEVAISVLFGRPMQAAADAVRASVASALAQHSPLRVDSIDVRVEDVRVLDGNEDR